mmetsp:Transcript_2564/g.10138  ORF Transcript_2564/g.10138 Transcript_2564/m.10138 type:complete len:238 (+) Transcript_2564:1342-2055(+)
MHLVVSAMSNGPSCVPARAFRVSRLAFLFEVPHHRVGVDDDPRDAAVQTDPVRVLHAPVVLALLQLRLTAPPRFRFCSRLRLQQGLRLLLRRARLRLPPLLVHVVDVVRERRRARHGEPDDRLRRLRALVHEQVGEDDGAQVLERRADGADDGARHLHEDQVEQHHHDGQRAHHAQNDVEVVPKPALVRAELRAVRHLARVRPRRVHEEQQALLRRAEQHGGHAGEPQRLQQRLHQQ